MSKMKKVTNCVRGVISPLLANIYMHLVDKVVNDRRKLFYQAAIKIVRYAGDFVLMGKSITKQARERLVQMVERMGWKLHETRTRQVQVKEEGFNFPGFTVRYDRDLKGRDKGYWNMIASAK